MCFLAGCLTCSDCFLRLSTLAPFSAVRRCEQVVPIAGRFLVTAHAAAAVGDVQPANILAPTPPLEFIELVILVLVSTPPVRLVVSERGALTVDRVPSRSASPRAHPSRTAGAIAFPTPSFAALILVLVLDWYGSPYSSIIATPTNVDPIAALGRVPSSSVQSGSAHAERASRPAVAVHLLPPGRRVHAPAPASVDECAVQLGSMGLCVACDVAALCAAPADAVGFGRQAVRRALPSGPECVQPTARPERPFAEQWSGPALEDGSVVRRGRIPSAQHVAEFEWLWRRVPAPSSRRERTTRLAEQARQVLKPILFLAQERALVHVECRLWLWLRGRWVDRQGRQGQRSEQPGLARRSVARDGTWTSNRRRLVCCGFVGRGGRVVAHVWRWRSDPATVGVVRVFRGVVDSDAALAVPSSSPVAIPSPA